MRKFFLAIMVFLLSLPLLGNTSYRVDGIELKDFRKESLLYDSLRPIESAKSLNDIIFLPDGDFDQTEAATIISRINRLPDSMLTKINQAGIKIKLFTGKLTDNPTAKHLRGKSPKGYAGNTKWDDVPGIGGAKWVLVKIGASEKGSGHSSVNLELHELAHSVDRYVYDEIRENSEYLTIWEQEKISLFPDHTYFLTFPEEYFAETFAMYFLNDQTKEQLFGKAPKTFEFIQSLQ